MRVLLIAVLGCLMLAAPAAAQKGPVITNLTGVYATVGTNPGGGPAYQGQTSLESIGGGQYEVTQRVSTDTISGIGTFDGEVLDVYYDSHNIRAIYTLQADGSLIGHWGTDGGALQGTEVLAPVQ